MAFLNSGPSADMGASSNDADTALALGSANPTYGSPLSQFSDFSHPLLSSSESNSALGPAPSKRARRSRNAGATGAGASPPESPTEQDGFVTDTDMENFLESILNELAEETQQRNAQQESYPLDSAPDSSAQNSLPSSPSTTTNLFLSSYDNVFDDESSENLLNRFQSLNLGAEYRSSAQLDLDSDYTVPRNILDDFPSPQAEILPDFLLHDPSSPILYHGNDDQNTRPEILSTSPDFFPATVLHEDKSDKAQMFVEPDAVWWGPQDDEEMDLDANMFDSGGSEEDSESIPDVGRSRCPCNLCSPKAPTNPDYHPSRQSQQEIHRLFSQSPFAHPTHSTL
ncbi:hypothetical protein B0H14DRAFT_2989652 [Mycena olivaceomarginata]|nr:hypothetical protein B0H14DRAFT_2989652 [Mycena olivaceomarginata]